MLMCALELVSLSQVPFTQQIGNPDEYVSVINALNINGVAVLPPPLTYLFWGVPTQVRE